MRTQRKVSRILVEQTTARIFVFVLFVHLTVFLSQQLQRINKSNPNVSEFN